MVLGGSRSGATSCGVRGLGLTVTAFALALVACRPSQDPNAFGSMGETQQDEGIDASSASGSSTGTDTNNCPPEGCLDLPSADDGTIPCEEEGGTCVCMAPPHTPCDDSPDFLNTLGLNCDGEAQYSVETWGASQGFGTLTRLGNTGAFLPREGERFIVMGSGRVGDLLLDPNNPPTQGPFDICSSDLGAFDYGTTLPAPIVPTDVGMQSCEDDASLVGTGDCSNTIQEQFERSFNSIYPGANDYTELRFTATVPEGTTSFSYDFAFLTFEYPDFYDSEFNDMFIGWLESEDWTGNISFDEQGRPISVNASFMDYLDADVADSNHPTCPAGTGCTAEELTDTCMDGHGATRWLTTTAGVNPGEEITIVFAVMDLGDSILDSYILVDNFVWGCDGGPPTTVPID